jgi:hypothetical protein
MILFDYGMTYAGIAENGSSYEHNPITRGMVKDYGLNVVWLSAGFEITMVLVIAYFWSNWIVLSAIALLGYNHYFAALTWIHHWSFMFTGVFTDTAFWICVFALPFVFLVGYTAFGKYPIKLTVTKRE